MTSVASRRDCYYNALAESVIGVNEAELIISRCPWRSAEAVERGTLRWVYWWNTTRLHSAIGDVPPAEIEAAHYAQQQPALAVGVH